MITCAQKRFNQDYLIARRLLVSGKLKNKDVVTWLRNRGHEVILQSGVEIRYSPEIHKKLSTQSGFEQEEMEFLHEEEPYTHEGEE